MRYYTLLGLYTTLITLIRMCLTDLSTVSRSWLGFSTQKVVRNLSFYFFFFMNLSSTSARYERKVSIEPKLEKYYL